MYTLFQQQHNCTLKGVAKKYEISHFCQIMTKFRRFGDKWSTLYWRAEMAHDRI